MTQPDKKDFRDRVMGEIALRRATMRPRSYFIIFSWVVAGALLGVLLLSITSLSFSFFQFRELRPWGYLHFGWFGLAALGETVPWLLLLVAVVGVGLALVLFRNYDTSYKVRTSLLVVAVVLAVFVVAFILDRNEFGERVRYVGIFRPFDRHQVLGRYWVDGKITVVLDHQVAVQAIAGQKDVDVTWNKDTLLPTGSTFSVGQDVQVVGYWQDNIFMARGIAIEQEKTEQEK